MQASTEIVVAHPIIIVSYRMLCFFVHASCFYLGLIHLMISIKPQALDLLYVPSLTVTVYLVSRNDGDRGDNDRGHLGRSFSFQRVPHR